MAERNKYVEVFGLTKSGFKTITFKQQFVHPHQPASEAGQEGYQANLMLCDNHAILTWTLHYHGRSTLIISLPVLQHITL